MLLLKIPRNGFWDTAVFFKESFMVADISEIRSDGQIFSVITSLPHGEMAILEIAAAGQLHGGDPVKGIFLQSAKEKGLVYKSTGRLKPKVYAFLNGDTPAIVKRR